LKTKLAEINNCAHTISQFRCPGFAVDQLKFRRLSDHTVS
jgi:hypothetical protein